MLIQLVLLVICQTILADRQSKPFYDIDDHEAVSRHFEEFLVTHNKQYGREEKAKRFQTFKESLKRINELNKKHELTIYDINRFTDMTEKEKRSYRGLSYPDPAIGNCKVAGDPSTKDAPDSLDWRALGAVSPVKDQGPCGSCWAFGATAMVESRYLQRNKTLTLSEQQLVDCDPVSEGCGGGYPSWALSSLVKMGQMAQADYFYEHMDSECRFHEDLVVANVLDCTGFSLSNEDSLKELLYQEGPLTIGIDAAFWYEYSGGILVDCGAIALDHAVLLVGYGTENGTDYWIVKNSWGSSWGTEGGYIKLQRGVFCGGIGNSLPSSVLSTSVI